MNNSFRKTQGVVSAEQPIEDLVSRGGESLIAQLDSAVTQAEQLRNQQVHQQHNDQLGGFTSRRRQSKSTGCNPTWLRR